MSAIATLGRLTALLAVSSAAADGPPPMAPELALPDLSGRVVRLSAHRGAWVVIDFWATWCEPCREAMAEHARLAAAWPKRLVVLTVSVDEEDAPVRRWVAEHGVTLPVLRDPKGVSPAAYGVTGMPYAVLVDPEGRLVFRVPEAPYPRLRDEVTRRLGADRGE